MFWLQLPSLTLSICPRLPTSLSRLADAGGCAGAASAARGAQRRRKAMAAALPLRCTAALGSGLEEHNIPVSLPDAWDPFCSTPGCLFLLAGAL